ncbi:FG-GAP repeat domain-containing protein [Nucisporomicrobium flavum]|uniref:FG-GAP repeat domain-containing protein n=1 Tax=Nucisporomicrobium flavum TaxID=2785915 RepID=UPI0018F5A869|nr:VCBS repeat-containing protein [Nucisporomicrobium flavum]
MAGDAVQVRAVVAAALVAGSLIAATPAYAAARETSAVPGMAAAAAPSAPCQPAGVSAADRAVADHLRAAMTGPRMGSAVTGYNISCARAVVSNVRARGLNQRAAEIAVTAAIAESTLHNYSVAVDHDSLGLFQQRPSQGWGSPGQLLDPRYATQAFLNAMIRKHPGGRWLTGDIGQICQRVQGSRFPLAYAPEAPDARLIVAALWPGSAAAAPVEQGAVSKPASAKKPAGPFRRDLAVAVTSQGWTDARHDMSTADWNGDRRPDLVVVQRSGTGSGRTELFILDGTSTLPKGASSFQYLLLHTGTVLGPTDERHTFSLADWNGDGKLDLVVVQRSGTASGRTELRVVDGASAFQRYLLETTTVLGPTDERHAFAVTDWNRDGRLDLVVVQKSGTPSKRTEARILDGASQFQRYLEEAATAVGAGDARHDMSLADWNGDGRPDLVVVQKSGTKSGKTEVRVLDGAATFRRVLFKATTALGPTDARHGFSLADWNGDGKLDLVEMQKSGTASGRTEAHVLAG